MKKYLLILVLTLVGCCFSCSSDDDEELEFETSLLIGKWASGTEFFRFDNDGTGVTWDTKDDVQESEGQSFTWALVKSTLTENHTIEIIGGEDIVIKTYKVLTLNETTLSYEDENSKRYTFTRQ